MKNDHLEQALTDIGLSEGEARLYLTMLSVGPSPILKLSRLSGLKRTTIYGLIERLKNLGIARIDVRGFKRLFVAESPEHLETVLENRKSLLRKYLPELEKLERADEVSFLKYYEGIRGIKGVYEDLLQTVRSKDEYLVLSNQAQLEEQFGKEYLERFQVKRSKLPINMRLILQDSETARHSYEFQRNINARIKLLPSETKLTTNLIVIPGRVVIHQLAPPALAIVIENKSVIQMHREMFEIIWNSLPE